jgi:hypothetical protein
MLEKFKILLSAGCSFTHGLDKWNQFTAEQLNLLHTNYGAISAGNSYINKSITYGVAKALETYHPSEILVGIMWSGSSRYDYYHSDLTRYNYRPKYNFIDEDTGAWVRITQHNQDWYTTPFFKLYYDDVGSHIDTFDNILKTQCFLENKKVEYFMTTYAPDTLPDDNIKSNPHIKYLSQMINYNKFLPIDNCFDWCIKSGIPGHAPDEATRMKWLNHLNKVLQSRASHPTVNQHKGFAEQVVIPFIKKNYHDKEERL